MTLPKVRQRIQKNLGETISQLSSGFLELSTSLKTASVSADIMKKVDKLFKTLMESTRSITSEITSLMDTIESSQKRLDQLSEEKRRLEVLYASGILFSSATEMKSLMEIAIETVVKELKANAGFIILANEDGSPSLVVARNIDPDAPEAREMSTTVIQNTLVKSKPTNVGTGESDEEFLKHNSIIRLGIKAALCVPLVSATKTLGAVYLDRRENEKPFTEGDLVFLLSFAKQIVRGIEVSMEIETLEKKLFSEASLKFEDLRKEFKCDEIVGSSRKLFDVLKIASKIASTDTSLVLLGENGTGKDLLAHAIHKNSRRSEKPFVTINCGAIPHDLLESELFGYESGAFTGATKSKPGKIEFADGGTLFLDEIGELSVNLQAKLLRTIQTKEIERLGGIESKKIDVRFIAATNRNVVEMIEKGQFREDLYYRLKVVELTMPLLRERREDIAELVDFFLKKHSPNNPVSISPEALEILEQYSWPGNVRELENVVQRGIVLAKSSVIEASDLPPEIMERQLDEPVIKVGKYLQEAEIEFRRFYIIKTLREAKSKAEAAQMLGINRTHFYKLLSQLGIDA